jgi:hypothetical protein
MTIALCNAAAQVAAGLITDARAAAARADAAA